MKRLLLLGLLAIAAHGQPISTTASQARPVSSLPATCNPSSGSIVALTTGGSKGLYSCTATNTWTRIGGGAVGPTGATGATGSNGSAGAAGATGVTGATGTAGAPYTGCTQDGSNGITCTGGFTTGSSSSNSGFESYSGATSGSAGFAVPAVAGTAILYLLPSTAGTAGQLMQDTGSVTCPSLPAGAPSLCHQLAWVTNNVPQNSQSTAYTTVMTDAGKHLLHPTADNNARTFTIDSNANVAYPIGTTITFVNQINTLSIAITSDTLQLAGGATTGTRTLAAGGMATALKVTSTLWIIGGSGLT